MAEKKAAVRKKSQRISGNAKNKGKQQPASKTHEIWGILWIALGFFAGISLFAGKTGLVGQGVAGFLKGMLGMTAYALPVFFLVVGWLTYSLAKRSINGGKLVSVILLLICVLILFHLPAVKTIAEQKEGNTGYSAAILGAYKYGMQKVGGAGAVGALFTWPFMALLDVTGSYIVVIAALIGCLVILTSLSLGNLGRKAADVATTAAVSAVHVAQERGLAQREERIRRREEKKAALNTPLLLEEEEPPQTPSATMPEAQLREEEEIQLGIGRASRGETRTKSVFRRNSGREEPPVVKRGLYDFHAPEEISTLPREEHLQEKDGVPLSVDMLYGQTITPPSGVVLEAVEEPLLPLEDVFSPEPTPPPKDKPELAAPGEADRPSFAAGQRTQLKPIGRGPGGPVLEEITPTYDFPPPIELLTAPEGVTVQKSRKAQQEQEERRIALEETLASFGIEAKVIGISRGPRLTRYELQPARGVKVSRITSLSDDIALNLAATSVRIEAPIPGKPAVGVEVANAEVTNVTLREVLSSQEFQQHPSTLAFALGRDIAGRPVVADLAKMPHVLVAGATGAGKSVCINSLIASILYKARPDEVKLILIDPKVVELKIYNDIPHLLVPVVTDPHKAAGALGWAVVTMEERYKKFADASVRDIAGYNTYAELNELEPMPKIVIIIDELADLMMVAPGEVEQYICRLAQLARAAGIHLVIATQRPSVNVITGIIKANIPSRIAFAVTSQVDSRVILDMSGAEKLLGRGDMLYDPSGASKPMRVQGCFISDKEVSALVNYVRSDKKAQYDEDFIEHIENREKPDAAKDEGDDADELLPQAIAMAVELGEISTSMIQRRFRVGYARAGRIVDEMEKRGWVSGHEGSKPRTVLIQREEFNRLYGGDQEVPL